MITDGGVTWEVSQPKYLFIGTVASVTSRGKFGLTLIGGTLPDQWLQWGVIIILSGAAQGFTQDICINHVSMVVTLAEPLFYTPAIGDRVFVQTGCDKTIITCNAKFANQINFRGFPFMPGTDQYFQIGVP